MALTLPNLGLKVWNLPTDPYDSQQLADNWARVDNHDHTPGKGVQVPTAGIADSAITAAKIAPGAISTLTIPDNSISTAKLVDGAVTGAKILDATIATGDIADNAVTSAKIINDAVTAAKIGVLPKARVWADGTPAVAIANNVQAAIAFDTEIQDSDTIHDNATNNSRLTCKTAGWYTMFGNIEWPLIGGGFVGLSIRLNGTTFIAEELRDASATYGVRQHIYTEYQLAVNDYIELLAWQISGSSANVTVVSGRSPIFGMSYQGD